MKHLSWRASASLVVLLIGACAACDSNDASEGEDLTLSEVAPALFVDAAIVGEITEESCILSGGTEATCLRFSVNTDPVDHDAGPWCPETIRDDASEGGIWPEGRTLYDVDGPFIENLADFYNDPFWQMYDDAGNVFVTETQADCAAAANPNVGDEYANFCVECQTSYIEPEATITYVIPKQPVLASGGTGATSDPMGVAFNGIPFYAQLGEDGEEPADLDACRGHTDDVRGYHYHVAEPGTNQFVGCFRGEYGCALAGDGEGLTCDATQGPRGPNGRPQGGPPPGVRGARLQADHTHAFAGPHDHH